VGDFLFKILKNFSKVFSTSVVFSFALKPQNNEIRGKDFFLTVDSLNFTEILSNRGKLTVFDRSKCIKILINGKGLVN